MGKVLQIRKSAYRKKHGLQPSFYISHMAVLHSKEIHSARFHPTSMHDNFCMNIAFLFFKVLKWNLLEVTGSKFQLPRDPYDRLMVFHILHWQDENLQLLIQLPCQYKWQGTGRNRRLSSSMVTCYYKGKPGTRFVGSSQGSVQEHALVVKNPSFPVSKGPFCLLLHLFSLFPASGCPRNSTM